MTDLLGHIIEVGETWQRYSVVLDLLRRNGMSDDGLRNLIDARNAHRAALDAATLAALKAAHAPVLERSLARAAKSRERR